MSEGLVKNQPPSADPGVVRLAVVAESPSHEEVNWHVCSSGHGFSTKHWQHGQLVSRDRCVICGTRDFKPRPTPMVGESGRLLNDILKECGLPREKVFVGNVSRFPISDSEKKDVAKCLESITGSLAMLAMELEDFKPNVILALGGIALAALHPRRERASIIDWRGSILEGSIIGHPQQTWKVVAARHPAAILHEPNQLAILRKDIQRAVDEASSPTLDLPQRKFQLNPPADFVVEFLRGALETPLPLGFDIEGGCDVGITVLSLAPSPEQAVSIPFKRMNWSSVWTPSESDAIWRGLRSVLECPAIPKVTWNGAYEAFCLAWLHDIKLANIEDGMIAWSALLPELERGLDTAASLLTRQNYWGRAGDWETDEERDTYNCIDSCVTLECWRNMQPLFSPAQRAYYETQRALLEPVLDMMCRGFRFDTPARDAMRSALQREVLAMTGELSELAGIPLPSFKEVAETVAMKVKLPQIIDWPDICRWAKPSYKEAL